MTSLPVGAGSDAVPVSEVSEPCSGVSGREGLTIGKRDLNVAQTVVVVGVSVGLRSCYGGCSKAEKSDDGDITLKLRSEHHCVCLKYMYSDTERMTD